MEPTSVKVEGSLTMDPEKLIANLYHAIGEERILAELVRQGILFRRGTVDGLPFTFKVEEVNRFTADL